MTASFRLSLLALLALCAVGCSSATNTTKTTTTAAPVVDLDRVRLLRVLDWLDMSSVAARSLKVEGSMTAVQKGSSQSASFTMKSKRLSVDSTRTGVNTARIDSLGIEVSGPFGITVARFLASPESYTFYDALRGDVRRGATDNKSLRDLTQLEGVSLETMSDVLYGLAPGSDRISATDSLTLYTLGTDRHLLIIRRIGMNFTEGVTLEGVLPERASDEIMPTQLSVVQYDRWPGILQDLGSVKPKPEVSIRYKSHQMKKGLNLPMIVEAKAKDNSLTLEYSEADVNPQTLTVRVKLPK